MESNTWNTEGKPNDMPLEEWLWVTNQRKKRKIDVTSTEEIEV